MITVIYRRGRQRSEFVVSMPSDLFPMLYILEASEQVDQYKVTESDVGIIRDFNISYGWSNESFTKNAPDGFTWPDY